MCIVITAGGIDLTVGALLAWGSIVAGLVLQSTESIPLACAAALLTSGIMGLITGVLISQFNLFPFVATLAMQDVYKREGQDGAAYSVGIVDCEILHDGTSHRDTVEMCGFDPEAVHDAQGIFSHILNRVSVGNRFVRKACATVIKSVDMKMLFVGLNMRSPFCSRCAKSHKQNKRLSGSIFFITDSDSLCFA